MKKTLILLLVVIFIGCMSYVYVSKLDHLVIYKVKKEDIVSIDTLNNDDKLLKVKYNLFKVIRRKNER